MEDTSYAVVTAINQLKRAIFKLHEAAAIVGSIIDNTPDSLGRDKLPEEYEAISTCATVLESMLDELLEDF